MGVFNRFFNVLVLDFGIPCLEIVDDNVDFKTDSSVNPVENPIRCVLHALRDILKALLDCLQTPKLIESVSKTQNDYQVQ